MVCFFFAEQAYYLPFLIDIPNMLESCDNCTSEEIVLPFELPFGGYFHKTAFVSNCYNTKLEYLKIYFPLLLEFFLVLLNRLALMD